MACARLRVPVLSLLPSRQRSRISSGLWRLPWCRSATAGDGALDDVGLSQRVITIRRSFRGEQQLVAIARALAHDPRGGFQTSRKEISSTTGGRSTSPGGQSLAAADVLSHAIRTCRRCDMATASDGRVVSKRTGSRIPHPDPGPASGSRSSPRPVSPIPDPNL